MALGAGLRFAVPEIHNIRSNDYSEVGGAHAFGPRGEHYVAFYNENTSSKPAGANAWHGVSTNATQSALRGFVLNDAGSATANSHFLGQFASSAASNVMAWIQVGGTITAQITGAESASADVIMHGYVGLDTASDHQSTGVTAISGNYGLVWAPQSANSTLATMILAGKNFG